MRAKVLFICLLFACGACAQVSEGLAKNKVYQGFSGGMMLHTGYLFGQDGNAPKTAVACVLRKVRCLVSAVPCVCIYGNICARALKVSSVRCRAP